MWDKSGTKQEYCDDDKELNFFVLPGDIDTVASAVKAYKGVVFGVTGSNPGWQDLANPRPPLPGEAQWGHALYAYGYHLHDGQKCIIAKSSWCNTGITELHIKENYFNPGMTFNPWTLIPKEQSMAKYFKINDHGKLGIMILEGFSGTIIFENEFADYQDLLKITEGTENAPTINIP
jgi:hypothetical protein